MGLRSSFGAACAGAAILACAVELACARGARAQEPTLAQVLEHLQRVESDQQKLRAQLDAKDREIAELKRALARMEAAPERAPVAAVPDSGPPEAPARAVAVAPAAEVPEGAVAVAPPAGASERAVAVAPPAEAAEPGVVVAAPQDAAPATELTSAAASAAASSATAPASSEPGMVDRVMGRYAPGRGFALADTPDGTINLSLYTYLRYLNQKGLDATYVNGLGETVKQNRRNDVELNKVKIEFKGWFLDPKFNYVLYTWTNNTAQGQGAQVVVGGNLRYEFAPPFMLGGGIYPLPSVRSNEGAWPYFLGVDHRTMTDEFFRGSYTMGLFANGAPLPGVRYSVMVGDNLSILGVDAGQLDARFSTVAAALWWMPTTGEFGPRGEFGDYADHQEVATRIGAHFTFSPEDKQEQPGTEAPDNTQIRLSNGTVVFTDGALAPGVVVDQLKYYMTTVDGGMKYRGFSLEGEYYLRWLNDFDATGPIPESRLFDTGFQAMTSMMLMPKTLQVYVQGAYLFGEFGEPWEVTSGVNWWVLGRRELRLNLEYIYDYRSPVGYSAIPQALGGTGSIFNANFEMFF